MSISDGFSLWIGEFLAEFFMVMAIFATALIVLFVVDFIAVWREGRKRKRAFLSGGDAA
jgi:hypothetical protein